MKTVPASVLVAVPVENVSVYCTLAGSWGTRSRVLTARDVQFSCGCRIARRDMAVTRRGDVSPGEQGRLRSGAPGHCLS
jgi:hypothetical protein